MQKVSVTLFKGKEYFNTAQKMNVHNNDLFLKIKHIEFTKHKYCLMTLWLYMIITPVKYLTH